MIALSPPTDRELLAAFVKTADGSAFAALTERHLGLVFGVACRRTGSREMAQEAAQNTFCQLARHAPRLTVGTSLGPWLHAVALREAGTLLRAEAARLRALERLAVSARPDAAAFSPSPPPPPGSEHLDEALAALPEAARRVLVLRYLQGMSLREVAIEEDTSEEAARKRVTRALDRLTRSLARRGVTAAGVTACLAAAPVLWPAPSSAASLAARALQQAAAPAAGAGLSGLAGFALSQWPAAAVFLLAAVPAAWPWGEASQTVKRNEASARVSSGVASDGAKQNDAAEKLASPAGIAGAMMREMGAIASKGWSMRRLRVPAWSRTYAVHFNEFGGDALRLAAARRVMLDFSLEEVRAAGRLCEKNKDMIDPALYSRWAELNPEEARQAALASGSLSAMWGVLQAQAATDLPGVARWAGERASGQLSELLEPLAASDPAGYLRIMNSLAGTPGGSSKAQQYYTVFPNAPELALEGWRELERQGSLGMAYGGMKDAISREEVEPAVVETLLSFSEGLPDDSALRAECQRTAAQMLAREEPERAADLLMAAGARGGTELEWKGDMECVLKDWRERDPVAAAQWLVARSGLDPDAQRRMARVLDVELPVAETSHPVATP